MQSHVLRVRQIRSLAGLLLLLSLAIIAVSAYIRLGGAGLGCAAWPECYGQLLAGGAHPHSGFIRTLHRVTASLALLLAFALTWLCVRPRPIRPLAAYATALVVLMIALTLVGVWSADPHRVWASFFNMLGGLGLVVLSSRLLLAAGPELPWVAWGGPTRAGAADAAKTPWLAPAGLAALLATLALGALIGARYAALSCATAPFCGATVWPPAAGWAALNPLAEVVAAAPPGDAGGITLHLLHRYCAAAALVLLGLCGLRALTLPGQRLAGAGLLLLLGLEFALGSLTVISGFSLWLAVGHSVCAALLLAATLQLLARRGG